MTTIIDNRDAFRTMLAMKFDEVSIWQKVPFFRYEFKDGGASVEWQSEAHVCRGFTDYVAIPYEDLPEDATPNRVANLQICCQNERSVSVHCFDAVRIRMDDENRVAVYEGKSEECE